MYVVGRAGVHNGILDEIPMGLASRGQWVEVIWSESQNDNSCAGINRHEAENARVSRERGSDPLGPEF